MRVCADDQHDTHKLEHAAPPLPIGIFKRTAALQNRNHYNTAAFVVVAMAKSINSPRSTCVKPVVVVDGVVFVVHGSITARTHTKRTQYIIESARM